MVVTVDLAGTRKTFLLGSREGAADVNLEVYSESSPLGAALNGRKKGDSASYVAPNGKTYNVDILDVTPFKES